jgi:phospholipid/cholesterol/gamma-HCH transport system substrate-binding protein
MKFSIRFADQIVGTLVILALAILVVVVFMLGKTQRWFTRDVQYKTYFNSASGLSNNMEIKYKGFTMGNVKKIMLADDDRVEVIFSIFEEHKDRIKEGTLVELQASPIGMGNAFLLHPGKGTKELDGGSEIPEINSQRAREYMAEGMADRIEASDSINNIFNQVNSLLNMINLSLAGSQGSQELPLGRILADVNGTVASVNVIVSDLSQKIDPILTSVDTILNQASSPSGTVMSLLDAEGPVYTNIAETLDAVSGSIKSVERAIEFVPDRLPQITVLLSDLHSALREAEKLITALNNNPIFKGGVPVPVETGPGASTSRDLEFLTAE